MVVTAEHIAGIVARWTGTPVEKVIGGRSSLLLHLKERLHENVIGQEPAVSGIAQAGARNLPGGGPNHSCSSSLMRAHPVVASPGPGPSPGAPAKLKGMGIRFDRLQWLGPCYGWTNDDLAADPKNSKSHHEAKVTHAGWAILGTVGYLIMKLLAQHTGGTSTEPAWFQSGARNFSGGSLNHFGSSSLVRAQYVNASKACQDVLMGTMGACCLPHLGEALSPHDQLVGLRVQAVKNGCMAVCCVFDDRLQVVVITDRRLLLTSMPSHYVRSKVDDEGHVGVWASHAADALADGA